MRETTNAGRLRKVLLIGGTTVSRVLVESILADAKDFVVVGAANGVGEVVAATDELRPDLIVIDLCTPHLDGGAILAALRDRRMVQKAILSKEPLSEDDQDAFSRDGARAFFVKKEIATAHEAFRDRLRNLWDAQAAPTDADSSGDADAIRTAAPGQTIAFDPLPSPATGSLTLCSSATALRSAAARVWSPNLTEDEAIRLLALRALGIANLDEDRRLDVIVRHLCHVTGYAMAAINLIDQSLQWTKAAAGLDRVATPRVDAICNHTIMSTTPLIVSDTLDHPVFSSFACVQGAPHIRSYVGVPLFVEYGLPIGAICLLDHSPRSFVQNEIRVLHDMADLVVQLLDPSQQRVAA